MKCIQENVTLIFSGPDGKELVMLCRFDGEKTKKTLLYNLSDVSQEDIARLLNNGDEYERNKI